MSERVVGKVQWRVDRLTVIEVVLFRVLRHVCCVLENIEELKGIQGGCSICICVVVNNDIA